MIFIPKLIKEFYKCDICILVMTLRCISELAICTVDLLVLTLVMNFGG